MQQGKKLIKTLRIAVTLIMARTFGRYVNSGWNGEFEYARYEWRGREWCIPMTPYDRTYGGAQTEEAAA